MQIFARNAAHKFAKGFARKLKELTEPLRLASSKRRGGRRRRSSPPFPLPKDPTDLDA